ncbi:unnamed protein product [Amoebophrya sp. A120]|nr:unnamed protein product [Amoebophrya sp. A120]|eukprot:GSA120T00005565001.1
MMSATLRRNWRYYLTSRRGAASTVRQQSDVAQPTTPRAASATSVSFQDAASLHYQTHLPQPTTPRALANAAKLQSSFLSGKIDPVSQLHMSTNDGRVHEDVTAAVKEELQRSPRRAVDAGDSRAASGENAAVSVAVDVRSSAAPPTQGKLVDVRIDGDQISPRCIPQVFELLQGKGIRVQCATYYRQGGEYKHWQAKVNECGPFPVPVRVQVPQNITGGLRDPGDLALAMDTLEAAIGYHGQRKQHQQDVLVAGNKISEKHENDKQSTVPDGFVVVSGDLDFIPLYNRLQAKDSLCYVLVDSARLGTRRSEDLRKCCTELFTFNRAAARPENRNFLIECADDLQSGPVVEETRDQPGAIGGDTATSLAADNKGFIPPASKNTKNRVVGHVAAQPRSDESTTTASCGRSTGTASTEDSARTSRDRRGQELYQGRAVKSDDSSWTQPFLQEPALATLDARAAAVGTVLVRFGYLQRSHRAETEVPLTPTAMATFLENCGIYTWRNLLEKSVFTGTSPGGHVNLTPKKGAEREKLDVEGMVNLCFDKIRDLVQTEKTGAFISKKSSGCDRVAPQTQICDGISASPSAGASLSEKIRPWLRQRVYSGAEDTFPLHVERPFEIFTATFRDAVLARHVLPTKSALYIAEIMRWLGYYDVTNVSDIRVTNKIVPSSGGGRQTDESQTSHPANPCLIEAMDVFMIRNKYLRKKWKAPIAAWVQSITEGEEILARGVDNGEEGVIENCSAASSPGAFTTFASQQVEPSTDPEQPSRLMNAQQQQNPLSSTLEAIYPGWAALDGPQKAAILCRLVSSAKRFETAPYRSSLVEFVKAGILQHPGCSTGFPIITETSQGVLTNAEMLLYDRQLRSWLQQVAKQEVLEAAAGSLGNSTEGAARVGIMSTTTNYPSVVPRRNFRSCVTDEDFHLFSSANWQNFFTTLTVAHTLVRNQHNPQVRSSLVAGGAGGGSSSRQGSNGAAQHGIELGNRADESNLMYSSGANLVPKTSMVKLSGGSSVTRPADAGAGKSAGVAPAVPPPSPFHSGTVQKHNNSASATVPPRVAAPVAARSAVGGVLNKKTSATTSRHQPTTAARPDPYGTPPVALGKNSRLPSALAKRQNGRGGLSTRSDGLPSSSAVVDYTKVSTMSNSIGRTNRRPGFSAATSNDRKGRRPRRMRKRPARGPSGRSDSRWDSEDFEADRPKSRLDEMYGF